VRRLLLLVSATVLLESTFFAVLAPLLPHYKTEFGLSASALGALSAVYAAGGLVGAVPSGLLAVRVGVRPTVLGGLAIIVVTSVAFGFAESAWVLYAARFGQGVGSALAWTGGLAWLVAAAPRGRRGELIGIAMGARGTDLARDVADVVLLQDDFGALVQQRDDAGIQRIDHRPPIGQRAIALIAQGRGTLRGG